ncbi:MAG TPA: hypothetical protein VGR26_17125 [Acidimicrobiales bacterium]|nr:hypothetical protein [Acidimicrobiales bacterium]
MSPKPGTTVEARNAFGEAVAMVAVTAPQAGLDFPIVWVCSPEEYERAQAAGEEPEAIAWPLDALEFPASAGDRRPVSAP